MSAIYGDSVSFFSIEFWLKDLQQLLTFVCGCAGGQWES
jgi:hypothetical protein